MPRLAPALQTVSAELRPEELVLAWRPATCRLLLETWRPVQLRQRLAVQLLQPDLDCSTTITGSVASLHRRGQGWRFEFDPDGERIGAVLRLVAVARGEACAFEPRPRRWLTRLPAVVAGRAGGTYMLGTSLSERGFGLTWSGPPPPMGASLQVRLGAGHLSARVQGQVRWLGLAGRGVAVGLQLVAAGASAWSSLLWEVVRSGAPFA